LNRFKKGEMCTLAAEGALWGVGFILELKRTMWTVWKVVG
jgi:hypothetical protein